MTGLAHYRVPTQLYNLHNVLDFFTLRISPIQDQ